MQSRLDWINDWDLRAQDCGYNASKLAHSAGVTLRLLQIFFQERFRATPHVWMLRVRMTRATGLLMAGVPLKSVSHKLGYKQGSHFSREFKCFFGVPPSRYAFAESKRRAISHSAV